MPYIPPRRREGLREPIDERVKELLGSAATSLQERGEEFSTRVEKDIYALLTCDASILRRRRARLGKLLPAAKLLWTRKPKEPIGGDINFCICRYLVLLTQIHTKPKYEEKIQWIQERLEGVRLLVLSEALDVDLNEGYIESSFLSYPRRRLGILNCVGLELYIRFALLYEEKKRKKNGDIWE